MTVYAITDTKKGRTGIAPTYLQTTPLALWPCTFRSDPPCESIHCRVITTCTFYVCIPSSLLCTAEKSKQTYKVLKLMRSAFDQCA